MELFIGIFVAWGTGITGYAIYSRYLVKHRKIEYYDLSDRVVKGKRFKDNINNRAKGIFNK